MGLRGRFHFLRGEAKYPERKIAQKNDVGEYIHDYISHVKIRQYPEE
jgi:hypothetical protein